MNRANIVQRLTHARTETEKMDVMDELITYDREKGRELMEEEPTIVEEPAKKPIDTSMDFSEEEIEAMLEEESRKALNNFTEPLTSEPMQSMDLFPAEEEEEEDNDIMGWFPTPKE